MQLAIQVGNLQSGNQVYFKVLHNYIAVHAVTSIYV